MILERDDRYARAEGHTLVLVAPHSDHSRTQIAARPRGPASTTGPADVLAG